MCWQVASNVVLVHWQKRNKDIISISQFGNLELGFANVFGFGSPFVSLIIEIELFITID